MKLVMLNMGTAVLVRGRKDYTADGGRGLGFHVSFWICSRVFRFFLSNWSNIIDCNRFRSRLIFRYFQLPPMTLVRRGELSHNKN